MGRKPLYTISVVSEILEMHPQTIRQYERIGFLKPSRTDGNTRLYSDADIDKLKTIAVLTKEKKVNLAGVEIILALSDEINKLKDCLEVIQTQIDTQETPSNTIKIKIKREVKHER